MVNDYLRTLSSERVSWLPRISRAPYPLETPDEIHAWHDIIMRECMKPGASYNGQLQEHGVVFLSAVRRLDELAAQPHESASQSGASSTGAR